MTGLSVPDGCIGLRSVGRANVAFQRESHGRFRKLTTAALGRLRTFCERFRL
jgi:hypothetical protein